MDTTARNVIQEPAARERRKILLVDSQRQHTKTLEEALLTNFEIRVATSANEALKLAEINSPDAIILDLNMPNIDSYELLGIFHNHPAILSVPVVCVGEDNSSPIRERIEQLGACGFLKKPFDFTRIADDLRGLLYSLNRTVKSNDNTRAFTIAYSETEKYNLIHKKIKKYKDFPETMVLLSWIDGNKFITKEERSLIESGKLIFLEIKPSLIVKFPYLQDMSPIFHDIGLFIDPENTKYHLIFDELRNILNVYDGERSLAKSYALARLFEANFARVTLFNTKAQQSERNMFLLKISKVFVQSLAV